VAWFLEQAKGASTSSGVAMTFAMQTNGMFLDDAWLELLGRHEVRIGVSCDGPQDAHDRFRRDHAGRGTYAEVRRAMDLLQRTYGSHWGVLTVADPELSAVSVLKHFAEIGVPSVDFLWPDHHHDDPPPWPPGSLAKYYSELFDFWYG